MVINYNFYRTIWIASWLNVQNCHNIFYKHYTKFTIVLYICGEKVPPIFHLASSEQWC